MLQRCKTHCDGDTVAKKPKKSKKPLKPNEPKPLSDKQKAFVREYLIDLNATAAAERAGYKKPNKQGPRLLVNVGIQAAITAALQEIAKNSTASIERLEQELERIALSDPRKLFGADGAMKPVAEWDDATTAAIASIESIDEYTGQGPARRLKGHVRKLKLWEKGQALIALLKRRDIARTGELGSKDNPIHHRISFIEFADVEEAETAPGAGDEAGRHAGAEVESKPGPAPRP